MGALCVSRDHQVHLPGVSHEELVVYRKECQINLYMVPYEIFRGCIKRYGYATDLTDKHMIKISREIMLDTEEMYSNPKSAFSLVYLDDAFRSADKRHSVRQLLRLGWFLCVHRNQKMQEDELWNLINPGMDETIKREDIISFVKTLTTFAVTINKKMLIIEEEDMQGVTESVAYLDDAQAKLEEWTQNCVNQLPRRINKQDCIEFFQKNSLYRSYTLREQIAGKRMAPKRQSQKEMQKSIPTPSPPKRPSSFGQKQVMETDEQIEFSMDSGFDNSEKSSQSPPSQKPKKGKKGKKVKLIKPFPTDIE